MTNTDSPLDNLVKTLNHKIEIMHWKNGNTTYQLEESAKQAIELYCHKQVIEELEKIIGNAHTDKGINWWIDLEDVHKRIAELRKTL